MQLTANVHRTNGRRCLYNNSSQNILNTHKPINVGLRDTLQHTVTVIKPTAYSGSGCGLTCRVLTPDECDTMHVYDNNICDMLVHSCYTMRTCSIVSCNSDLNNNMSQCDSSLVMWTCTLYDKYWLQIQQIDYNSDDTSCLKQLSTSSTDSVQNLDSSYFFILAVCN